MEAATICRPGTRARRGRPLADPEAGGRPGQDRSARCRQSGAAAPGRRTDRGMGSRCRTRGDARSGTGTARRGAQPAPARQQLSGFLLRHGCHYGRPAWTRLHRRWLAGLKFEQAVHHIGLEDYIAAVAVAEARRDRLTAQIEALLPDWALAPVVAALQTMRGMALVNAATLTAELGDLSRFANPRQLMAYLGLVPSEHSSGASIRRGGLTKAEIVPP